MSNTRVIPLNVKGINYAMLKKDKVQVALLQETHLTDSEHLKLKRVWVGPIDFSSFNSKSRGVAILTHKHLAFTLAKAIQDTEGWLVLMLPPTLNLAHISLILKMDKPPVVCSSYRPISLLWVDCKIVSKLLARRLEEVLPIWSDQIRQDLSRVGAPTRMSDGF